MTSELLRIRNWMESHNRRTFSSPPTPWIGQYDQMETLLNKLDQLAESLGMKVNVGTLVGHAETPSITPVILADLNQLLREVLVMYHVLGLAGVAEEAFKESFHATPNFQRVVDDYEEIPFP